MLARRFYRTQIACVQPFWTAKRRKENSRLNRIWWSFLPNAGDLNRLSVVQNPKISIYFPIIHEKKWETLQVGVRQLRGPCDVSMRSEVVEAASERGREAIYAKADDVVLAGSSHLPCCTDTSERAPVDADIRRRGDKRRSRCRIRDDLQRDRPTQAALFLIPNVN